MRNIRVVFSRPKKLNIFSKILMLIERSSYTHSAIMIETKDLLNLYAHSTSFKNVHINTQSYFEKNNRIVHQLDYQINDQDYDYIVKEMARIEGIPYGWLSIIGIGIARFFRFFFKLNVKNLFDDKNKTFFCSEFVWYILTLCGFEIDGFDSQLDGPKKLYQILSGDFSEGA